MLSKVSGLVTVWRAGVNELIGNLYISEYVIRNFSYLTSDADQMTMTGVPIDPSTIGFMAVRRNTYYLGTRAAPKGLLWFTLRKRRGRKAI